ncbi:TAF1A polymerase, partial [Amia calva]|nr:TAF1A polymerase [Amia calva]
MKNVVLFSSETLRHESGFHRTAKKCLCKIQEALLQQQWEDAAKYMKSFFQILEDPSNHMGVASREIIWRLGTEILHQLPNTKLEDFNSFLERMKNIGVRNYLKISLEHTFHLMMNGMLDDAKRQLSLVESWRYGSESASQAERSQLIQTYRGYLHYFTWSAKKDAVPDTEKYDNSDVTANQEMHTYFRQASVNIQDTIKQPGVWDPFVISYINMLEYYKDYDEALKVLNDYAYDNRFPPNPNAHVYLYQFLRKHHASKKKLFKVLRVWLYITIDDVNSFCSSLSTFINHHLWKSIFVFIVVLIL